MNPRPSRSQQLDDTRAALSQQARKGGLTSRAPYPRQGVEKGVGRWQGTDSWCREGMDANPVGMESLRLFEDRSLDDHTGVQARGSLSNAAVEVMRFLLKQVARDTGSTEARGKAGS